jgi:hypothetical protein
LRTHPMTWGTSIEWEEARFLSLPMSANLAKSVSESASRALLRDSSSLTSSMRFVRLIVPWNRGREALISKALEASSRGTRGSAPLRPGRSREAPSRPLDVRHPRPGYTCASSPSSSRCRHTRHSHQQHPAIPRRCVFIRIPFSAMFTPTPWHRPFFFLFSFFIFLFFFFSRSPRVAGTPGFSHFPRFPCFSLPARKDSSSPLVLSVPGRFRR